MLDFFDFGFTRFITNTWISFIWGLFVVLACLVCGIGVLVVLAQAGFLAAIGAMVFLPIIAALYLVLIRISLEFVIVVFRIETHLRAIRERDENK